MVADAPDGADAPPDVPFEAAAALAGIGASGVTSLFAAGAPPTSTGIGGDVRACTAAGVGSGASGDSAMDASSPTGELRTTVFK